MPEQESTCTQTITPALTVKEGMRAIDFYKSAFGAEEIMRMPGPDGQSLMHAELKIGNSMFFLGDEPPEMYVKSPKTVGACTGGIYLSVDDVDSVFKRALEAGAQQEMAVENTFWGDRMGSLIDPFGHHWMIATHVEDVPPDELKKRTEEFYAKMAAKKECDVKTSV